ncbi:hypothetical protein P175DRAFT_0508109 [Aspergillus ochraceoroseus IBT 24754]|uniref:Extracellular membrane protein CFEM domain-containing protein n=1 Tax=Aspergillus ochraceoroseus IBT 24754 TaxID=1392256 RepID=A0A2T5M4H5_9EURO|nr:uncharacterized protein P175DRAFT_0508109 [Aspergillus ochraceoroseus IBT 24754]PTU23429.1 hypothetical protein P175DRAFT_0508109 [Aspergillus ochraceoroseus IBT 24754]
MKLNIIALTSLLALVVAEDASSTTTAAATATTSLSPEASCAANCGAADRCCRALCFRVPCPSEQQANDTVSCVAACPQGNGSPADTEAYAQCQASCYSTHYFPATATLAESSSSTSSGSSSATTTGSSDNSDSELIQLDSSSSNSSSSGTATGSGSSATHTGAASITALKFSVSALGLGGFFLAAWAL